MVLLYQTSSSVTLSSMVVWSNTLLVFGNLLLETHWVPPSFVVMVSFGLDFLSSLFPFLVWLEHTMVSPTYTKLVVLMLLNSPMLLDSSSLFGWESQWLSFSLLLDQVLPWLFCKYIHNILGRKTLFFRFFTYNRLLKNSLSSIFFFLLASLSWPSLLDCSEVTTTLEAPAWYMLVVEWVLLPPLLPFTLPWVPFSAQAPATFRFLLDPSLSRIKFWGSFPLFPLLSLSLSCQSSTGLNGEKVF